MKNIHFLIASFGLLFLVALVGTFFSQYFQPFILVPLMVLTSVLAYFEFKGRLDYSKDVDLRLNKIEDNHKNDITELNKHFSDKLRSLEVKFVTYDSKMSAFGLGPDKHNPLGNPKIWGL